MTAQTFSISNRQASSRQTDIIEKATELDATALSELAALTSGATAKDAFVILAENGKRADKVTPYSIGKASSVLAGATALTSLTAVTPLELRPSSILQELKDKVCVTPNAGVDLHRLNYSLVAGTGDTHNALFGVDERAQLRALDPAQAAGSYTVRVECRDDAGNTATAVVAVTVN